MTRPPKLEAIYDPLVRRYRAPCPECGFVAVRSKREAAEHVLAQHFAYTHTEGGSNAA